MTVKRFHQSTKDAFRGLTFTFKSEQNFRIQVVIACLVLLFGIYFRIPVWQVVVLFLLVALVLILELVNTAIEYFIDLLKPRLHPYAGIIKDIMAGAVLIAGLTSLVVGIIIFVPYFIQMIK